MAVLLAALGMGAEAVSHSTWGFGADMSQLPPAWHRGRTKPVVSHQEFWESFKKRPGMYVGRISYDGVTAFLNGYDCAAGGALLNGFQQWLADKFRTGRNLVWPALVVHVLFPEGRPTEPWSEDNHQHAVAELLTLLEEFFQHLAGNDDATSGTD
jgi:hypothetical protein